MGGAGATPRFGQLIRFHYVAYRQSKKNPDGVLGAVSGFFGAQGAVEPRLLERLDSTYDRDAPYLTKHGNGFTCEGIEEALHTMRPGGRRRILLPPTLGYRIGDKGPIPVFGHNIKQLFEAVEADETLVFDLELVTVMDDLLDRGDYDNYGPEDVPKVVEEILRERQRASQEAEVAT